MSTNDGWNTDYPVNPDEPTQDTQPQRAVNFMQDAMGNQSRRKFLRAAVMSGAAVAAVGATAGVAAACQNNLPTVFGNPQDPSPTPSGGITCALKMEGSALDANCINQFDYDPDHGGANGQTNPGTFYLIFTTHNLPPGDYTMTITRDPGAHDIGDSPWSYKGSNPVQLFQKDNGAAADCPNFGGSLPSTTPPLVRVADDMTHMFSLVNTGPAGLHQHPAAYTIPGGPNKDLQLTAHLVFDSHGLTGDQPFTFHATLKGGQGQTLCTSEVSVTGKKKDLS